MRGFLSPWHSPTQKDIKASERDKRHPRVAGTKSTGGTAWNETIRRAVFFTDRFFYTSSTESVSRATHLTSANTTRGAATLASELVNRPMAALGAPYGPKTSFSARIPGRRLNIIIRGSRRPKARCLRRLPPPLFPGEPTAYIPSPILFSSPFRASFIRI